MAEELMTGLTVLLKCMSGIFVVIILIMFSIMIMNKVIEVASTKKTEKKEE
jgi:hypothetical protein